MSWLQAHITIDPARVPLIELLFEQLGAVAVSLHDAADEPMLEPAPGETPLWQANRVTGLFTGDTDADALRIAITQTLSDEIGDGLRLERLGDRDWERAWLDRFRPMRFGRRLWIRPSGHAVEQPDAVVVDLDPGLAFGTGTHPTTALCLRWLDAHDLDGRDVIDFGCGSGILAIAALKLGARHAIGIDHDPQALLATRDNALRNSVANALDVEHSEQSGGAAADIVIANILANVLIRLAPKIAGLLRPGAQLVMSGILQHQADEVMRVYAEQIEFEPTETDEDWVLLSGRRRT